MGVDAIKRKLLIIFLVIKGLDFLPKTKEYATVYIVSKKGDNIEVEQYETKKKELVDR